MVETPLDRKIFGYSFITKMDRRHKMHKEYGYNYTIEVNRYDWQKFKDLKRMAWELFGPSTSVTYYDDAKRYGDIVFRRDVEILNKSSWAHDTKYNKYHHGEMLLFKNKEELDQLLVVFTLSNSS